MSRRPARCTQVDIARAIKAVLATGVPGTIRILVDGTILVDVQPLKPANVNGPIRRIAL